MTLEQRARTSATLMGHPVSDETRAKISAIHRGRGHPQSEETRAKIGLSNTGKHLNDEARERKSGEKSILWRGGTNYSYGREFNYGLKKLIRKRDDYLCQNPRCYLPENGHHHHVHHIHFDKENNSPNNLITLCLSCHSKANFGDHDYWIEYYQNVQEMRGIS